MATQTSPIPEYGNFLNYLSVTIEVANFLMSDRLPATIENIRSYFRTKRKDIPEYFDIDDFQEFIENLIIPLNTLQVLERLVKKALKVYDKCLAKVKKPQERDACDRRVEKEICDILNRILNRNGGKLPSKKLVNHWKSFGCIVY